MRKRGLHFFLEESSKHVGGVENFDDKINEKAMLLNNKYWWTDTLARFTEYIDSTLFL
jgi:hypothetical protein